MAIGFRPKLQTLAAKRPPLSQITFLRNAIQAKRFVHLQRLGLNVVGLPGSI